MRRIVAAINMTLDGYCDHTAINPDEEIHHHYADLLDSADVILYGRITYQLMQYWQELVKNPSGEEAMDNFALSMDKIHKVVFSRTLEEVDWESARIAKHDLETEVLALKEQPGKAIFVGCRSLILQLMKLNLIDEYQFCVHPVIVCGGLPLFENVTDRTSFTLMGTKTFPSGAVILYYEPIKENATNI